MTRAEILLVLIAAGDDLAEDVEALVERLRSGKFGEAVTAERMAMAERCERLWLATVAMVAQWRADPALQSKEVPTC